MIARSPLARTQLILWVVLSFFIIPVRGYLISDVPSLVLVDVRNNIYDISKFDNKPILLLFFNPQNSFNKEIVSYAEVVFKRYNSMGLRVFGISNKDNYSTLKLFEYGQFSFPFISDPQETIHKIFNIKGCCGGIVLINRDKKIIFNMSYLLKNDNLKQLVEKEVLGKINYSYPFNENDKELILRQKLPQLPFLDIQINQVTSLTNLSQQNIVMTFLSSFCPVCRSSERIRTLKRLQNEIDSIKYGAKIILVFFKPYDERDIQAWDKTLSMPFDKYIALEDIYSDEEKYVTDESLKTDPLTIVLDKNKQITFVERLGMEEMDVLQNIEKALSPGGVKHENDLAP